MKHSYLTTDDPGRVAQFLLPPQGAAMASSWSSTKSWCRDSRD